jgi:hypothetical protein
MAQGTLLDIAKLNGNDAAVGLIEENLTFAPELTVVPGRTIRGTSFRTVARDTYPGVGFRNANEGFTYTKSTFLNRTHECYIFGGNMRADVAAAGAHEDGPEAYKALEASGFTKNSMIKLGSQFFYGSVAGTAAIVSDAKGFFGLNQFHDAFVTELGNRSITTISVDAAGTTSATGSSVYGVKFGDQGLQFLYGNNMGVTLGDWFTQMVNDGNAGSDYLAYIANMTAWIGLQAANPYCIGRIKKLTDDSGKGLTDSLGYDLLAKYPTGYVPDVWFMTRRSRRQLQKSRSVVLSSGIPQRQNAAAVGAGGGEITAPLPTEMCGIPIVVTDSLVDTETLA